MRTPQPDTTPTQTHNWKALIPIACTLVVLAIATVTGAKEANVRFAQLHLTTSADHIRTQMDDAPTGQITRAAIPPNYADNIHVKWTAHDTGHWAACIDIGPRKPWHLIFAETGPYRPEHGTCPTTKATP